jgi:signal transduction histidine kinase
MSAQPAAPAVRHTGWSAAARLAPLLDPAIGVVAVVLSLVSLFRADVAAIDPRLEAPDAVAVIATVLASGALAWRRSHPVLSFAAMVVGSLTVSLTNHYIGLLSALMLFSLYSLAAHGRRRDGLVGLGVAAACFVGLALLDVPDLGTSVLLQSLALLLAAWALGDAVRSRRQQQQDQQRELVEAAVTEERLRIARELHDVVAHSMSLIAVQAGVGAHVIRTDLAAAEQSLEVIADTSRKALEQTRSMLGLLRESPADGTRPPTRDLADVTVLVEDVRAAGLDVRLTFPSAVPDLDAPTSLAAYRIVQEALTNVIKHSAARTATVTVVADGAGLSIEVGDPGPGRPDLGTGTGHGLLGLRERARLLGGTLESGTDGGGFRVRARLPWGAAR